MRVRLHAFVALGLVLWALGAAVVPAYGQSASHTYVVAQDGSGDFETVQAAVDAVPAEASDATVYVNDGVYREKLVIPPEKRGLTLEGESAEGTIITYDDYSGKGDISTSTSYTARIAADEVRVHTMTFRNTAGRVGQAVAMLVDGDRVAFFGCRFLGNQDTLYVKEDGARQYFEDCYIEGTTDFIFGGATAVFENCRIYSKKSSYITAASTPATSAFGFVFMDCTLTSNDEADAVYLGRPWRNHARTVFLRTEMGAHIRPEGWHNWSKPEAEKTAFYAEYDNSGPGADRSRRVVWAQQLSAEEAARYTTATIFGGDDDWYRSPSEEISWDDILEQDADWYETSEAIRIADNVLLYQHESGGWPKNIDMSRRLSATEKDDIRQEQASGGTTLSDITIDNGATYTQIRYLARVHEATGEQRFEDGALEGIDYLLEAQYENGGWPQYYPLRDGYYENITFNDGAMIGAMRVLRDVARGSGAFAFVDSSRQQRAAAAIEKGVELILDMQIEVDGEPTAWCAQYDPETLEPVGARSYEPPSISGGESVGVVEYLMEMEEPSPEVIRAVEAAVDWFERVKLTDIRLIEIEDSSLPEGEDIVVGFDPTNDAPLWARFYEIGTNRPIFMDREGNVYRALSQIPNERRTGYSWLGGWARELLEEQYPDWRTAHDPVLAFPSAEGYGKYTKGGRGGAVYEVTNLNDEGPGSLRTAVEASGPRTVVFRVSGTIELESPLEIVNPYITIVGQTAPGDGIAIKDYPLQIGADEVIIRYLRLRLGDESGEETDALWGRYHENIIIDHVSASWGTDEVLSLYHNRYVTIQHSIISESLGDGEGHKFGAIWGDDYSTYHHNLIAHHESRTPRFASGSGHVDFRNNVIYNWGYNSVYGGENQQPGNSEFDSTTVNVVANYYKPGPATEPGVRDRIAEPSARGSGDEGRWYVAENVMVGDSAVTADNWRGVDGDDFVRLEDPWSAMAIHQHSAEEAYHSVLETAGATLPTRDAVDTRIIDEVRSGDATYEGGAYRQDHSLVDPSQKTGIIDSQDDVGGWPELESAPPSLDSDHDGMPDAWERAHDLNPNDPSDRNTVADDGYTMLEKYLHSLADLSRQAN